MLFAFTTVRMTLLTVGVLRNFDIVQRYCIGFVIAGKLHVNLISVAKVTKMLFSKMKVTLNC